MVAFRHRSVVLIGVLLGLAGCKRTAGESDRSPAPPPVSETPPAPPAAESPSPSVEEAAPEQEQEEATPAQTAFDREHLRDHVELLALTKEARAQLDHAVTNAKGDGPKARATAIRAIQKVGRAQEKRLEAFRRRLDEMDLEGDRSHAAPWHRMNLQFLADEYPASLVGLVSGDPEPIREVRGEMDRYQGKLEAWLAEIRQAP